MNLHTFLLKLTDPSLPVEIGNSQKESQFLTHQVSGASCNSFQGEIADINEKSVLLHFFEPPGELPNRFFLDMCNFGMQPTQVHQALSDFWMPIWNRDDPTPPHDLDTFQAEVESMNLPKFGSHYNVADVQVWQQTIATLKSTSSPGSDGWHNSELKALPQRAVEELVAIFLQPTFKGFEAEHMRARVVSLPKKEQVTEATETRPIIQLFTDFGQQHIPKSL